MIFSNSTIALSIRYFNIVLTVASAIFAIYGLIVILGGNSRLNVFRHKMFLSAFCVASLLAFAIETVCFNYKHYLKYFAGGESYTTEVSSQDPTILLTSDSVLATIWVGNPAINENWITFKNLDRRVTSVFVQPNFNSMEQIEIHIRWTDEESTRGLTKTLYKGLPHENHTAIQSCGNVSELTIMFWNGFIFDEKSQIAINRQIPFYFSGLRLFVISMLFFAIILFVHKPLRVKTAYYLFEYKFDPANKKQNFIYVWLVVLTICFSGICVCTSPLAKTVPFWWELSDLTYNKYLVDALIAGRTNIDIGHPEKLLNAKRPYDRTWLEQNGYKIGVDFPGDISYYKGKFYTYYGVVPAVFLYIPYKLITGKYMSHNTAIFVFATIAIIFLALLWRFLVEKYMPTARFAFYILSFLALFFVSHLFAALRFPGIWTIVQTAGFAFVVSGIFLLFKSVDNENITYLKLFFACLCFALSVGCRPPMVLFSIIVPVVLWKHRSWKIAFFILIPYIIVALPLCLYNYTRFDSIFEFGIKYTLSVQNYVGFHLLNPLGTIHRVFITFVSYLFRPYIYSLHFPFVKLVPLTTITTSVFGFVWVHDGAGGLINFPILFCLLYLVKNIFSKDKPYGFYLSLIFLIIATAMLIVYSVTSFFIGRYFLDCAVLFVLPSLFCAYYWCDGGRHAVRLKIVYGLLVTSIFIGMFLFVSGCDHIQKLYYDPVLYRYLEYSLGIIECF